MKMRGKEGREEDSKQENMKSLEWQVKLVFVCFEYPRKPPKGRQKEDMIMIMFE